MAKPFFEESGNGFHTHYSLWQGGKNIFSDGGKLSAKGRNFIGGLQKRMAESSLCGSATENGFRRRQPYTFCPINTTWGMDNRTVGIRVIEGSETATRVEKRDAGADCNPYLLLAADIAAGLDGIEQGLEPSAMTTGNAYEDQEAEPIPTDLETAIGLARNSNWLKGIMGDDMHELYCQQSERELEFLNNYINNRVTQHERDRYLGHF